MPHFRSFDKEITLPSKGNCHTINPVKKPDDWDNLRYLQDRTDRSDHGNRIHVQDRVVLCIPQPLKVSMGQRFYGFKAVFYQIVGLTGR